MIAATEEMVYMVDPVSHTLATHNGSYVQLIMKEGGVSGLAYSQSSAAIGKHCIYYLQGAHPSGKSQGNLIFLQGQGKVREFCKMVREIRKSSKVREKSGNFKIMPC